MVTIDLALLEREMYAEAEAARLLNVAQSTLHYWLEGELAAVKVNNARMVALAGDEGRGTWQQLEVLMRQWRATEALARQPGPFVYTATRSALKAVRLS